VTITFLLLTVVAAVIDWLAVYFRWFRIEYVFKPLTMVFLVIAASAADLGPAQPWIVAGLVCGLAGDVALMLSDKGRTDPAFLAGLGAFLVGHVAYIIGFLQQGVRGVDLVAGLLVIAGLFALVMPAILRGASAQSGSSFAALVAAYGAVAGIMAVLAAGTGLVAVAIGGGLFAASDSLLGYQRFVRTVPYGDLVVIVTYHAAQFLFVVGLMR
jgi:uncharacterized membrane protein YhhN